MTQPVTGAPGDVGAGPEARDRSATRGPSRVPSPHATALERIRTSSSTSTRTSPGSSPTRIATADPRERSASGEHGRARPRHRLHAHRRVPRAHPHAPRRGAELRQRRDVQSRRVLPDGAGQHPLVPPVHVGEPVLARGHPARERAHPARRRAARPGGRRRATSTRRRSRAPAGIDFQILGIGKTGHIGFNEPGSGADSRTRLVHLDAVTRRDAAADFFGEEYVPREAITMGVATILEAREIAHPRHRRAQGARSSSAPSRARSTSSRRDVPPAPPQHDVLRRPAPRAPSSRASRRRGCSTRWSGRDELDAARRGLAVAADASAPSSSSRSATTPSTACRRWSRATGRPARVNGEVFNALGAKIRGKSKLPRGKRTICFSPHPDDDVISMGGILRKFVRERATR